MILTIGTGFRTGLAPWEWLHDLKIHDLTIVNWLQDVEMHDFTVGTGLLGRENACVDHVGTGSRTWKCMT
jgi:hypothetical protein